MNAQGTAHRWGGVRAARSERAGVVARRVPGHTAARHGLRKALGTSARFALSHQPTRVTCCSDLTTKPLALRVHRPREYQLPPCVMDAQRVSLNEPVPLRSFLLAEVLRFTLTVAALPGVSRIALMGSLATSKAAPNDADVLVSVASDASLDRLARAARALKGHAQTRNSGADIFLADLDGRYIGRICHWRECRPGIRLACRAQHCGRREFLHDDLQVVRLASMCVAQPPELWPTLVRRGALPADVERILLGPLQTRK